ncbi:MAG: peptidase M48, partial [Pseudanabaenales cyanobacterium]|nr:peptidase M48 [Pseudanabaenales cyanobacterium]
MPITLPPGTAAQRDDRNPTPNNRQLLTLLGLLVGLVGVVIGLVGVVINQLVWWIPPSVEQQLGATAVPPFERLAEPSRRQTELNRLLDRLEAELSVELRQGRDYQVLYVPEPTVNA